MATLLGLCGSLRGASLNRKLMLDAAQYFDADPFVDGSLRLPLYDGDVEAKGLPAEVQTLADQVAAADAVLVVSPEYNKGPSGVLKNALDWISRVEGKPWAGKPVAILSATAGRSGGERMQAMLRLMMQPFRPDILQGPEVLVGGAAKEFDEDGHLKEGRALDGLKALMAELKART